MDEVRQQNSGAGLSSVAQGVLNDFEKLLGQHIDLLRAEFKQDLAQARNAVIALSAGAGTTALGGILGTLAGVHLLQRLTGWPLWFCYALVGGSLGLLGTGLIGTGMKQVSEIDLVPKETIGTVKRELAGVGE